jgi:hypothetical protein
VWTGLILSSGHFPSASQLHSSNYKMQNPLVIPTRNTNECLMHCFVSSSLIPIPALAVGRRLAWVEKTFMSRAATEEALNGEYITFTNRKDIIPSRIRGSLYTSTPYSSKPSDVFCEQFKKSCANILRCTGSSLARTPNRTAA